MPSVQLPPRAREFALPRWWGAWVGTPSTLVIAIGRGEERGQVDDDEDQPVRSHGSSALSW